MIEFCSRFLDRTDKESQKESETEYHLPSVKAKQLREPFIKLEDINEKYRPSIKEFVAWPEIIYDAPPYISPLACIQVNTNQVEVGNDDFNRIEKPECKKKKLTLEIRVDDKPVTQESKSGIANTITSFTTNKSFTTRSLNGNKSLEGLMLLKHQILETKEMKKKSQSFQFCEICNSQFSDIQEVSCYNQLKVTFV